MKVEEMALRSEIRQMLNEAGFNRETIKQLVKESIDDVVKNQVNQVLMEREEKSVKGVVEKYLNNNLHRQIRGCVDNVIREKLRWMEFKLNIQMENKIESEENTDGETL